MIDTERTNHANYECILYAGILITVITCYALHIASTYDMEQFAQNASAFATALVIPSLLICFIWAPIFLVEMWIRELDKLERPYSYD